MTGVVVHHDQVPVYARCGRTERCLSRDQGRLSFALNRARDSPEMESFIGRFKVGTRSLSLDAQSFTEREAGLSERGTYYNRERNQASLRVNQEARVPLPGLQEWRRLFLEIGEHGLRRRDPCAMPAIRSTPCYV